MAEKQCTEPVQPVGGITTQERGVSQLLMDKQAGYAPKDRWMIGGGRDGCMDDKIIK